MLSDDVARVNNTSVVLQLQLGPRQKITATFFGEYAWRVAIGPYIHDLRGRRPTCMWSNFGQG